MLVHGSNSSPEHRRQVNDHGFAPELAGFLMLILQHLQIQDILQDITYEYQLRGDAQHALLEIYQTDEENPKPYSKLNWLRIKLRNRDFDGTRYWKFTNLSGKRNYSHAVDKVSPDKRAAELSIYALDPRFPFEHYDKPLISFIKNPFEALPQYQSKAKLIEWFEKWLQVMCLPDHPYPGYFCHIGIPKIPNFILAVVAQSLFYEERNEYRYSHLTVVPTWYHTAKSFQNKGFTFTHPEDSNTMRRLDKKVEKLLPLPESELDDPIARHIVYSQRSWIVMLQFWFSLAYKYGFDPIELCPESEQYNLHRILYPLKPTRNLWMEIKLTEELISNLSSSKG